MFRVIGLAALLVAASAHGEEQKEPPPETEGTDETRIETLETSHATMSAFLEQILTRTDALFSGARSYDAPTGSYIMLGGKFTFQSEQDGGDTQSPISRAKITLPKTQERLQLLIERDIAGTTQSDAQRDAQAAAGQVTTDDNPYVALRGLAAETLRLQLTADGGVRMRSPPDPYGRLRGYRLFSTENWQVPLSETLLWQSSQGFSATTELGFLRSITERVALGFVTDATWRQRLGGFDLSQTANLAWRINRRSLAVLELGAYGTTKPQLTDTSYSVAFRYRRYLYRDWLLVELRPQVFFTRVNHFNAAPGFVLQLEAYFGSNYLGNL